MYDRYVTWHALHQVMQFQSQVRAGGKKKYFSH